MSELNPGARVRVLDHLRHTGEHGVVEEAYPEVVLVRLDSGIHRSFKPWHLLHLDEEHT